MTSPSLPDHLFSCYDRSRRAHIGPANCTHAIVTAELEQLVAHAPDILKCHEAGQSLQGRSIQQVEFGHGSSRILLWTQMHGDEPTATLAVLDLLGLLIAERDSAWVQALLEHVTVCCVVMLNPDGAELCRRQNAVQIDLNRDAWNLATPEARILRETHRTFLPGFAFNLHDQSLSSAGETTQVAALALLAPPLDSARSIDTTRLRALRMGAFVRQALSPYADGHLTRYPDDYEGRAFGDRMQSWGTSTLLIESGHWPDDPDKAFVRKLNAIALLSAFSAIGDASYLQAPLDLYFDLPPNGKRLYDMMLSNVVLKHPSGWTHTVQVGLNYVPRANATRTSWPDSVVVKEVGDLRMCGGLRNVDARNCECYAELFAVDRIIQLSELSPLLGAEHGRG